MHNNLPLSLQPKTVLVFELVLATEITDECNYGDRHYRQAAATSLNWM